MALNRCKTPELEEFLLRAHKNRLPKKHPAKEVGKQLRQVYEGLEELEAERHSLRVNLALAHRYVATHA